VSQSYVGEIRMFGGTFAPSGWALCNGQLLSIADYSTLFQLIGTTYGGDGQTTYGLPNLQSRVPIHQGTNSFGTYVIGAAAGEESVTVDQSQIPTHTHTLAAAAIEGSQTGLTSPAGNVWGPWSGEQYASSITAAATMQPVAIGNTGGNQPHDNMIPFLVVNFIISLFGVFPSRN